MSPFKRVLALLSVVALSAGTLLAASAPANADVGVVISNISPNSGPIAGGTTVVISGSGFTGTTDVVIGATPASFTEDSDTQITAIAPASAFGGGFADVMVVGANGMYNVSAGFEYIAPPATAPTITSLNPGLGLVFADYDNVITGTGFTGATSVTFGGTPAVAFTVDSDTQITATAPAHPAGPVDVYVTTPGGTGILPNGLTYTAVSPSLPSNVYLTPGDTTLDVTWDTPFDGGSPITGYLVEWFAGTTKMGEATIGVTNSYTVTGLINGTQYLILVRAINAIGSGGTNGAYGTPVAPPATVPGAPTGLTATPGNTQVDLSWTAPASDGGSPLLGYTVIYNIVGDTPSSAFVPAPATSTTITGLTNGATYEFFVKAENAIGSSTNSSTVTATPMVQPPSAPQNLGITPGNTELALTWDAPASDGGSPISGYFVAWSDGVNPPGNTTLGSGATSYTIPSLTNGTDYTVEVRAQNIAGNGPSAAGNGTPVAPPATAPSAPLNLVATPGNGQITITWDAPASDGGSPITQYGINYDDGQPAIMVTAPASTYTITGLTNGTTYTIGVYAKNTVGNSGLSNIVTATPATVPGAPVLSGTAGDSSATLSWTVPADGGSPITSYVLYSGAVPVYTGTATTYTLTNLTNGTAYTFSVVAVNAVDGGSSSNTVTLTPTAASNGGGSSPAQDSTPQVVTVTWDGNGAKCDYASSTVPVGTTVNAPGCTAATGYNFVGWDRPVPFTATSNVTVTANMVKTPGKLTVTKTTVRDKSITFVYAYDDTTPVTDFVVLNAQDGSLACSSVQGTEKANTCTAVNPKGNSFYVFAKAGTVAGPGDVVYVDTKKTIRVNCERVGPKRIIKCDGWTTNFAPGDVVIPLVKIAGETDYIAGSDIPVNSKDGTFSWQRKTKKTVYVYFTSTDGTAKSDTVRVPYVW